MTAKRERKVRRAAHDQDIWVIEPGRRSSCHTCGRAKPPEWLRGLSWLGPGSKPRLAKPTSSVSSDPRSLPPTHLSHDYPSSFSTPNAKVGDASTASSGSRTAILYVLSLVIPWLGSRLPQRGWTGFLTAGDRTRRRFGSHKLLQKGILLHKAAPRTDRMSTDCSFL